MSSNAAIIDNDTPNGCKLERKTIGSLNGNFFVPSYQRGYRWGKEDVRRLLDDLWESNGRPYNLQPIVVKQHPDKTDNGQILWELIDGQQRLTTLYLVFRYIQQQGWRKNGAPFKLNYETRPQSQTYLENIGSNPVEDETLSVKNIDYFHLYQSYCAINQWFEEHGETDDFREELAANLRRYLYDSVGVIWYEAASATSATELFTRLNIGRIPLTDAELIKAALLTTIPTPDRAQEIAAQWDGIERDLHQPDIWAFVTGLAANVNDEQYPTRISLLLDTLADASTEFTGQRPRYHTFDQLRHQIETEPTVFWEQVVALHAQILGWLAQPILYNKIGFLVIAGKRFGEFADAAKRMKKSELDAYLTQLIQENLNLSKAKVEGLNYEADSSKLQLLLLLMNIETVSKAGQRFPFAEHLKNNWSIEHIHAQNAESLHRAEQWCSWLENHLDALKIVTFPDDTQNFEILLEDTQAAIKKINANLKARGSASFSGMDFAELSGRILKYLGTKDNDHASIHSLCNLALLSSEQNSSLSNSVFEVKRRKILNWDYNGQYIPACTRNIFLKYYSGAGALQPHFWSIQDKDDYLAAIHTILTPYYLDNTNNTSGVPA